ncbi:hypothetical protein BJF91_17290 [Allorhizobium taibaishanense]|uniref:Uncharacterized protein n=1 Tax=Allorhizobium taibaishanense TaxID=887144 RepID=A0A1Q9A336_9HYPH|nr:hypothetical protein [Allorhizobium taibaishanense]OLP48888.1 hypothetical protein BJF91_17290 [Allorhizobium taibaishanense]
MKPDPPLFTCLICEKDVPQPRPYEYMSRGRPTEHTPICKSCTSQWGNKISGPVFNRRNFQVLRQLKAMITLLEWEIQNGHFRHR